MTSGRSARLVSSLLLATLFGCNGDSPTGPSAPTMPPVSTTATVPPEEVSLPASWLRYGADGLFLVDADGAQEVIDRPIGWAASDGAGGTLFTEWSPDRFGPTWWLPGGSTGGTADLG